MSGQEETLDERRARFGRNEAIFRVVNDRIEDLNRAFDAIADGGFEVVCECGEMGCVQQLQISTDDYSRIRKDPTLFILVPGHEDAAVESVVEDAQRAYVIVRKHPGSAAEIAVRDAPE